MADLLSIARFKNLAGNSGVSNKSCSNKVSSGSRLNGKEENMLLSVLHKSQDLSSYISSASKTSAPQTTSNVSCGKKVTLSEMIKPKMSSNAQSSKSASDVLNSMAKPVDNRSAQVGQKIDINTLISGVKTPKAASASYDAKKSTTVTLNELASKCRSKASSDVAETTQKVETGVKKSVISNALGIESLVPKISLNSIGKKNSFFK